MPEIVDITPEDSIVPVYSVVFGEDEAEYHVELELDAINPDEMIAETNRNREAGLAKLVALGLTEEEAKAVVGL